MTARIVYSTSEVKEATTTSTHGCWEVCDIEAGEFILFASLQVQQVDADGNYITYIGDILYQGYTTANKKVYCTCKHTHEPNIYYVFKFYVVLGKN